MARSTMKERTGLAANADFRFLGRRSLRKLRSGLPLSRDTLLRVVEYLKHDRPEPVRSDSGPETG